MRARRLDSAVYACVYVTCCQVALACFHPEKVLDSRLPWSRKLQATFEARAQTGPYPTLCAQRECAYQRRVVDKDKAVTKRATFLPQSIQLLRRRLLLGTPSPSRHRMESTLRQKLLSKMTPPNTTAFEGQSPQEQCTKDNK